MKQLLFFFFLSFSIIGLNSCSKNESTRGYYTSKEVEQTLANPDEAMKAWFNSTYDGVKEGANPLADPDKAMVVKLTCTIYNGQIFPINVSTPKNMELLRSGEVTYSLNSDDFLGNLSGGMYLVGTLEFNKSVADSIIQKNRHFYLDEQQKKNTRTVIGKLKSLEYYPTKTYLTNAPIKYYKYHLVDCILLD